jgi:hypothetical protein
MMNKNLPAFLWHMMKEQGLPDEFIDDLLNNSCEATMLAKMHECKWDPATKMLTTAEEESNTEKSKAFKGAAWFRDEFGLLAKNQYNKTKYTAPEALFNLDDTGLRKTIHNHHGGHRNHDDANVSAGTPPRGTAKGPTKGTSGLVDLTKCTGESASHTSSSSLDDLGLSDKGPHSKSSEENTEALGATNGG